MKDIKDYLHFHLGCEVEIEAADDPTLIISTLTPDKYCDLLKYMDELIIKPILRPKSNMTEEEMQECGNMDYDFTDDKELNRWSWKDFDCLLSPAQFIWFLSKHFDLFGLIEAGLAIDKTKL